MASIKNYLIALLTMLFFLNMPMMSQERVTVNRSENKVVLEGKIYYVHVVKHGHTLYSIAKAYNVSEKEIIIENPGASQDLIIGQVLKIPSDPSTAFEIDTREPKERNKTHEFKEGETLYAISREYQCSVEDILELNPGLDINDIPIGHVISLPGSELEQNELSFDEEGFIFHKVKRGETLFSISRYYGVSINEIRTVNMELGWGGPRSGDVIRIPKPNTAIEVTFKQDSIDDTFHLMPEDTIDLTEAYTYDELLEIDRRESRLFRIAYLIPFNYSEMEVLDTLLKDIKSPLLRERITEDYMLEAATPKSVNFLEFMEGSLLAIDSLTDAGMNLDIHVYDTKRSMHRMRSIMDSTELKDMDLIIGPFYSYNLELINDFAKKHRIPVVTPFHSDDSLLVENPYLFQAVASAHDEFDHNAAYIGHMHSSNLILVHDGDSASMPDIEYYKNAIFKELKKYTDIESVLFKEVVLQDGNTDALVHALNPDCKNLIILPSTGEAFASQVASRINYELENFEIELFGSSYWFGFDDIEISYIHALNLRVSHNHWYDYTDPKFLSFMKKYRMNYFKEPSMFTRRGTNYGIVGYDLSLYFLSALDRYGPRFILRLKDYQLDETISQFGFKRISRGGGYSNSLLNYYFFDDNLDVYKVDLPEKPTIHHYLLPAGDDPIYFRWSQPEPDTTDIESN